MTFVVDKPERLWERIEPEPNSGCWLWVAGRCCGYGRIRWGGRSEYAHRAVYMTVTGRAIPEDLEVNHICRVRSCVNPAHLEIVTHQANVAWRHLDMTLRPLGVDYCRRGHLFSEENTRRLPNESRRCRTCLRIIDRRRRRTGNRHIGRRGTRSAIIEAGRKPALGEPPTLAATHTLWGGARHG